MENSQKVEVYSNGIVSCSVCAENELTLKEIEEVVNYKSPTGIESKWRIDMEEKFITGQKNGLQCPEHPSRKHYLLHC